MPTVAEFPGEDRSGKAGRPWPTVGSVDGPVIPVFSSEELEELLGGIVMECGSVT